MKIIEARGSHRALGEAIGEGLRDEIRGHIEGFVLRTPEQLASATGINRKVLSAYLPKVLEQFEGIAAGAGVTLERILALNLSQGVVDADPAPSGCSNVVFSDGPDGPLWGKNNDGHYPPATTPVRQGEGRRPWAVLKLYPDDGIPALCVTFCGWLSGGDMMNAEGLAVGHSSVGSRLRQSPLQVPALQWLYWVLFRSRDLATFQRNLAMLPLYGKGFSMVAVDRRGALCAPELPCPLVQIRPPAPGATAMHCVNHYQVPELAGLDRRNAEGKANSLARSRRLQQAGDSGDHSLRHLQSLLRQHGEGAVCRHSGADLSWTEYSMIGITASATLMVAAGTPCDHPYETVRLV